MSSSTSLLPNSEEVSVDVHSLFIPKLPREAAEQTSLQWIVNISRNSEEITQSMLQEGRKHVSALVAGLDLLVATRNIINARLETATDEADRAKKTAESKLVQTYIDAGTAILGRSPVEDLLMSF